MKIFLLPLFLVYSLLLTGCAFNQIENGLNALNGEGIKTAFDYLGYPDSQQEIAGDKVYTWGTSFMSTTVAPMTSYTSIGGYGATTTSSIPITQHNQCSIKIITNQNDVITNSQYVGNLGGCARYGTALQRLSNDFDRESMANVGPEEVGDPLILCRTTENGEPFEWKTAVSACKERGGEVIKTLRLVKCKSKKTGNLIKTVEESCKDKGGIIVGFVK